MFSLSNTPFCTTNSHFAYTKDPLNPCGLTDSIFYQGDRIGKGKQKNPLGCSSPDSVNWSARWCCAIRYQLPVDRSWGSLVYDVGPACPVKLLYDRREEVITGRIKIHPGGSSSYSSLAASPRRSHTPTPTILWVTLKDSLHQMRHTVGPTSVGPISWIWQQQRYGFVHALTGPEDRFLIRAWNDGMSSWKGPVTVAV